MAFVAFADLPAMESVSALAALVGIALNFVLEWQVVVVP